MPERPLVDAFSVTVRGPVYQPLVAGADTVMVVVGGVLPLSILMVTELVLVPPALVAVHVRVVPVVFELSRVVPQPLVEETGEPPSVTFQLTTTSLRNQPLVPRTPFTAAVMKGGVVSATSNWYGLPWSTASATLPV